MEKAGRLRGVIALLSSFPLSFSNFVIASHPPQAEARQSHRLIFLYFSGIVKICHLKMKNSIIIQFRFIRIIYAEP